MEKQHENGKPIHGTPLARLNDAMPEGGVTNVFTGDLRDVCTLVESSESDKLSALCASGRSGTEIQVPTKDLRKVLDAILKPAPAPALEDLTTDESTDSADPPSPAKKGK